MAFDVASVKPSKGAVVPSNVLLTPWDDYTATNGRFYADAPLRTYIEFAYKLWPNDLQTQEFSHLPKWVASDRYSIDARTAKSNPTKDQLRLMVEALLADRFHLSAHFDARVVPVLELRLATARKPGPKLVPHENGPPCDKPGSSPEPRVPPVSNATVPTLPDGPTPLEGLRDQLGLKLEPAKASLPILVIDRADRPSEN